MICPLCNGAGKYKNMFGKLHTCCYCKGSGEVVTNRPNVTNEEWWRSCDTDELIEFLLDITENEPCFACKDRRKICVNVGEKCVYRRKFDEQQNLIREWLKAVHKE